MSPNFGYETKGSSQQVGSPNYLFAARYLCPASGSATSITVFLQQFKTDVVRVKCAIYEDANGYPGRLVGNTGEWDMEPGWYGWKTLDIISGGSLSANTYYWLVLWLKISRAYIFSDPGEQDQMVGKFAIYDGFPDPFPTDGTLGRSKFSIYCTYTTVVPPARRLRVESTPVSVPVDLDGSPVGNAPVEADVEEGSHEVEVPGEVEI